jgi:hypothetical protein
VPICLPSMAHKFSSWLTAVSLVAALLISNSFITNTCFETAALAGQLSH